jgi:hypothetical protein
MPNALSVGVTSYRATVRSTGGFIEWRALGRTTGSRPTVLPDSASSHLVTVSAWLVWDEGVAQIRTPLRLNGRGVSELLYRGGISVTVAVRGRLAEGNLVHHKPENVRSGRFQ